MSGRPPKQPIQLSGWSEPLWRCPCCDEPLPESRFGRDPRSSNGLKSWCKRCNREAARMRRALSGEGELGDWRKGGDA
jgi:hypothetical protein